MSRQLRSRLKLFRNAALCVGLAGLCASFIGAAFDARQFFVSYLFGYLFWFGLAAGCLIIAMMHHLTGGRWGYPIRRFLEAGFSTLPLMLLLFVPIFFGLRELYPWARTGSADLQSAVSPISNRQGVRHFDTFRTTKTPQAGSAAIQQIGNLRHDRDEILRKRQPYMSAAGFIARALFCLTLWSVMAWLLRRWSLAQDDARDLRASQRLRTLSGPGVLVFPLTATFAYVDWIMSLEKEWYSTIFAVIIIAGQVLCAFAFVTVLLKIFEREETLAGAITALTYHQLGNLLLAFVLFWSYVSFGQLLVVYSANLPQEIQWYLHRIAGSWKIVVALIAALHFFVPFFLLLFRRTKRDSKLLVAIAVTLFVLHFIAVYWLVAPSFHREGLAIAWLDFAAPIGIGGVWLAGFVWLLMRAPLRPRNDPRMEMELAHAA